jgi:hypothetical protein
LQAYFNPRPRAPPPPLGRKYRRWWRWRHSEDRAQRYIFVADGANMQVVSSDRQTGEKLLSFGRPGHMAGNFKWVHYMAIDSKGTIYTAEVGDGRRAQKFKRQN